jgi:hypothetical protein
MVTLVKNTVRQWRTPPSSPVSDRSEASTPNQEESDVDEEPKVCAHCTSHDKLPEFSPPLLRQRKFVPTVERVSE